MLKHLQRLLLIAALCVPWVTQAQGDTISTFPFTCSFEDATDIDHWSFTNSSNGWYIGSATSNGGSNSLYVSDNNGTSANYSGSACVSYAYLTFEVETSGQYAIQFDWKCAGESTYDFLRVAVASASTTLPTDYSSWTSTGVPTGFEAIDGGTKLNLQTSWQTLTTTVSVTTPGVYRLLFVWRNDGSVYNQPPACIDNVMVNELTCPAPTGVTVSDITVEGATLTWTAGGTETSWEVVGGGESAVVNTTTYTFSNLEGNTPYTVGVRAICGGGDTSFYSLIDFRTPCVSISTMPYVNDFENDPYYSAVTYAEAFPNCWTRINDASGTYNYYPYLTTTTTYVHSGAVGMYWYQSTSTTYANNEYAILPPVDLDVFDMSDLTLSFYAKTTSTSYHPQPIIGVMSDVNDVTTFVGVDTLSATDITTDWKLFVVSLANYTGEGNLIAIKWPRPSSACYMAIDDIYLTDDWCDVPLNIDATPTTTDVTVTWEANGGTSFTVFVGNDTVSGITGTSYTFTGRTPNTVYEYGVANECSGSLSTFIVGSTRTLCVPIDTLPYNQNFNSCSTGSSVVFDPCWDIYNTYSATANWPYASNGYLYMYMYASAGVNSLYAYAMLPELSDDLATTDMELSFDAWNSSTASYGKGVIVAIFDSVVAGMPTFDTVAVIVPTATSQAAAERYYVSIVDRDLTGKRIGFFYQNQSGTTPSYYYCYIDNVSLHVAPNCFVPGHLVANAAQADSVVITWVDTVASAWQVALGTDGFNPDTVSEYYNTTETEIIFDELTPGNYELYVRADCGDEQSQWIGPARFTPGAIIMPVAGTGTMYVCNAVVFDDGGAAGSYSANCQSTLTLYPNDETKRFKVWGSGSTEASYDYLRVYLGATATGTYAGQIYGQNQTIDTILTQGGPITLLFHSDGSNQYAGFELHVVCEDLPACRDVVNVAVPEVSASSAFITWENANGTTPLPNYYVVSILDTANTVVSSTTTTDMFAVLGGMDANTTYTVTVVSSCDDADGQAAMATFTTAGFGCLQVDETQAFSDTLIDGTSTNSYIPSYSTYNYSLTQQIFTATEIGHGGSISSIYFKPSAYSVQRSIEIYLGHTSQATASDYIYPADLTMVYSGTSLALTSGQWNEFQLSTPFAYNGTDNLLIMVRDMTGSWTSGNTWYGAESTSGVSRYVYQDSGPYAIGSTSGGTTSAFRSSIIIAGAPCAVQATCAAPLMALSNVTASTVDLMWASGSSESSWTVEHRAVGDDTWITDLASTTNTSYTVTGLATDNEYQFRVYHVCGTDTFATVRTARTACVGASVPFFENFSTWTASTSAPAPSCWFKGSDYNANYPYVSTSYSMGDGKSMYFYASGTTFTYLALPKFNVPIDTLVVTGNIYYSSNGYDLQIGYMTDPEDASTFHPVGVASSQASQWVPFEVLFTGMPDGYIAFGAGNGGSYVYLYLDNVEVNYYNPCERPRNLSSTNIAQTSATISWVDTVSNDFVVEYGPAGFTHGNGTTVAVSGNSVVLTGLTHSTVYDVYVRGICGSGDSSNWSFAHSFATSCGTIDALPRIETFDNWGTGSNVHAPMCWNYGSDYSTSYPYISNTTSHSAPGAVYMYLYDASHVGNLTWMALPELDSTVANVNQTQLIFYASNTTQSYVHNILIGVNTTPTAIGATWVDTVTTTYNVWEEFEVPLDSYTGNGHYIILATYAETGYTYSYPYIDDLTLELIPSCPRPDQLTASNATSNSIELGWHERANATNWIIEYGPIGFELGTGTTVAANSNPFILTGLPTAYQGEFYVRSVCSSTDTGEYSRRPQAFATSQIPATLPYDYNFEDPAEWANWQLSSNDASRTWYRGSAVADNSTYSMYISADSGATYIPYYNNALVNAAAFRDIDFGAIDSSFTITFTARVGGTVDHYYDGLMVFLVDPSLPTVPSTSSITSPWGNVNDLYRIATARLDTTWNTYTASFDTIHGVKRVAFFWFNQNTPSYETWAEPAAVDNIHIDYSECPRPVATTTSAVTSSTATLTWVGPAVADYEVIYRPTAGTPANNVFIPTSTNSVVLTGLDPLTQYSVWVRKLCGNDTSLTSDVFHFTTNFCDNFTEAYSYDTTMTAATSTYGPIGYSFYNYGYVQTLIDSARFASLEGEISAFAFNPTVTTAGDEYENMSVWMANVPESNLTNGAILPDSAHVFVQVINNQSFSYTTTGWQMHGFDTTFTWDGHSNVLVAVKRDNGSYTSGATFAAHSTSDVRTLYWYQDGGPIDYDNPSASISGSQSLIGDMMFFSCGAACATPVLLPVSDMDYQSATVSWVGSATTFEVAVKAASDAEWPLATAVNNTSYVINGLEPATTYQYRVRAICDAVEGLISEWVVDNFTTDSLPCFTPTNFTNTAVDLTTATFSWNVVGAETAWRIHVWNANFDETYDVNTNPATVTGLAQNTTYSATVAPLCGTNLVEGDPSNVVEFTTAMCQTPTDVAASNVDAHNATITWNGSASVYSIEYGRGNFATGSGTLVENISGTSYTITGLSDGVAYSVQVRAHCDAQNASAWSTRASFTTPEESGIDDVNGTNVSIYPNPTSGATTISLSGVNGEVTVTVVDMNGRTVRTETMDCAGDCTKRMEVSGLAAGSYFVRIAGEGVNTVKKLVVK